MLVLSRHEGESIIINNDIQVIISEIRGGVVRLAVEAPPHIPVHRQEVHAAIMAQQEAQVIPPPPRGQMTPPYKTLRDYLGERRSRNP